MLRRDTEYVLVWNAREHCWLARPVEHQGSLLVPVGNAVTALELPAWSGAGGDE